MAGKKLFQNLGYKEAIIFTSFFPIIGFILEIFIKKDGVKIPSSPVNIYILLGIVLLTITTHLFLVRFSFFKWLSSVPVAISLISYTTLLVLFMAFIPQEERFSRGIIELFGLTHISKNWAFLLTGFVLLYSLGLVILRRISKLTFRNFVFFLNHFGLWIIIAVAGLGSGDLVRLKMYVWENSDPEWRAEDENTIYELPFAIELIDFEIEEFNPELALVENSTGTVVQDEKNEIQAIEIGKEYILDECRIIVEDFYELAMRVDSNYFKFYDTGASPAAKLAVYDKNNKLIANDWILSESYMQSPKLLLLNDNYSIGLLQPAPKKYSSKVELYAQDGTIENKIIEVNKPVKFKGWKIYQLSYDESKGRWSELSVLELVRDPWIYVVYSGFLMTLIGSVCLFWIGKKDKE